MTDTGFEIDYRRYIKTESDRAAYDMGCRIDAARAVKVYKWFSKYLRHSKDDFSGKPFKLFQWQWADIIFPLYSWIMPDGTRRFTHAGIGIPKKNGKSTLIAGLACRELICGAEGGFVALAAGDRKQARIIFDEVVAMRSKSPRLKKATRLTDSTHLLRYAKKNSRIETLSADVKLKEGINPSVVVIDELHAQPNRKLWDTLKYAGAARKEFLSIWLSTAGEYDESSLWFQEFQYMRDIIAGKAVDISTLAVMYEATDKDDWKSEDTWRKANPSYGTALNPRTFRHDFDTIRSGADESIFKRYRLNLATKRSATWVRDEFWEACKQTVDIENFKASLADIPGVRIYAGLDLSLAKDFTAFTIVVIIGGMYHYFPYFWLPISILDEKKHDLRNVERYRRWNDLKLASFTTALPIVDYDQVVSEIITLCRQWNIQEVAIDKWNEQRVSFNLRKEFRDARLKTGVATISANSFNMSVATKRFEEQITSGNMRHTGNEIFDWMFGNVRVAILPNGNQMVDKGSSPDKIDGIYAALVALAVDVDERQKDGKKPVSRYERET